MDAKVIIDHLAKTLKSTCSVNAKAAVVALLKESDSGVQVLFVKRAENPNDTWSGQTALPGGKRDSNDKDLQATAVRETLEETGINLLDGCRFLGTMEPVRSIQKPDMKILPFVILQEKEQAINLNEELSEYFWMPIAELVHSKGNVKFNLKEYPAYLIENKSIWGLTYNIVHNLLALLNVEPKEN
ncbi:MAG: CoA pyrophosphatase [Candidatus Bathyarchaeota archaeon]|nr:CoA pyrophosphatase [Candidatus Bathyarchaeum sp.]